jgi:hypothetical protein
MPLRLYITFQDEPSARAVAQPLQLDVYLFDVTGTFVGRWSDSHATLQPGYYIELQGIDPGQYRVAAWATTGDQYVTSPLTPGVTTLAQTDIALARTTGDTLRDTPLAPLLFGEYPGIVVQPGRDNQYTMSLDNNVYTLNFIIEGAATSRGNYRVTVTDDNTRYRLDNAFLPAPPIHYLAAAHFAPDASLRASMNVLRLARERSPRLTLHQAGDLLFDDDLVALILQANVQGANIDFSVTRTVDITFRVDIDMKVTISINGWELSTEEQPIS